MLASFLATVVVAGNLAHDLIKTEAWDRVISSVVATIPAVMLLVSDTLRFEEQTEWFWKKRAWLNDFCVGSTSERISERPKLRQEYSEFADARGTSAGVRECSGTTKV